MSVLIAVVVAAPVVVIAGLVLFTAAYARRVEARVPPLGRIVEIDGMRLHYVDVGDGPVIVMVHGLGGNLRNFHALTDRLAQTHRVIAIDRPGCGYSSTRAGTPCDLFGQAARIAALMRRLDVQASVLVGHSLGGAVALALALDHAECVRALVLLAPVSHAIDQPPAVFASLDIRSPRQRRLIAWTLATPLGALGHAAMLRRVFAPEPVPTDFDTAFGGALGTRPRQFVSACADMTAAPAALAAMSPRYAGLNLPVDIVFGRQDPILDVAVHGERLVAAIPRARLHFVNGGHMIPVTHAEAVAERIRESLARVGEPR